MELYNNYYLKSRKKLINILFSLLILIIQTFCKKENKEELKENFNFRKGFFVVNEGNFTWGNSSLSFYDLNRKIIENDIFYRANGVPLGDVAMDLKIINNNCYIVVNNSGCIYITDPYTMKYKSVISNLTSPRYIVPISSKLAYVSDLYSKNIYVIDIEKNNVISSIQTPRCTEAMIKSGNFMFVTSWSFNNKVYVINTNTHLLIDSITVGLQPNSIVCDKDSNIWVLCDGGYEGNPIGHEFPSLYKIRSTDFSILKIFILNDKSYPARSLCINSTKDTLYFIHKHVYKMAVNDTILPSNYIISGNNSNYYSLNVSPYHNYIVITDAKNYVTNGDILVYSLNGTLIDKKTAGVIPRTITFIDF